MKDTKTLMKQVRRLQKKMKPLTGEEYYAMQSTLQSVLREALGSDLTVLSKKELFNLIALSSTHRPYAPHTILGYLAAAGES